MRTFILSCTVLLLSATPLFAGDSTPPPGARITEKGWFAPIQPKSPPTELPDKIERAFIIPIHGPITSATYDIIQYKTDIARTRGADMIIFEMDTPGGASDAMDQIMDLIRNELKSIYTLAYVHHDAYSAGALISLACDEIVMSPGSVLGDAMPIMISGGELKPLPKDERAKIESPSRRKIRDLAEDKGYNPEICEAMIDASMELWLMQHKKTRQLRIVDTEHWEKLQKDTPQPQWIYIETFDDDNQLVTLNENQMKFVGLARFILKDHTALEKQFRLSTPAERLEDRFMDKIAYTLTSPIISGLLVSVMFLCGYMELRTPGLGIFGAVAVLCLATLIGSRFLVGLANPVEIGIVALGIILIVLEIFLIPGFGVAGISGIVLCLVGLMAMWLPNGNWDVPLPSTTLDWQRMMDGFISVLGGFVFFVVAAAILSVYLPKIPLLTKSKLILAPAEAAHDAPRAPNSPMLHITVGQIGTTRSPLRPVGEVRFEDNLLDAVSAGGIIESGKQVRVLRREGNRIVVEEVEQT